MAQTILYYPQININDGIWLRNAVLYWDEISSIVPYENYPEFSPELLYLRELGIYKAIYPQDLFFSEFAKDFCDCIERRISAYDRSRTRNIDNVVQNGQGAREYKDKVNAPILYDLIYNEKLPPKLLHYFSDRKYINNCKIDGRLEIDSKISQIYMRTLAEYAIKCSEKDIVLGTDKSIYSREIYSASRKREDLQTQCCIINIENSLPQPSMDVGFEDILDFKIRRKDEFNAFRGKIRELESNIYNANSPELIRHYETQFIEGWQQCSMDFYRVLKEAKISFFLGSLAALVAIPYINQTLSSHIGPDPTSIIQTGASFLTIGVNYFNYKNKVSPIKADGGFSYIIKANRDGIIHI